MFVALERESSHWRQISSTIGVSRLVNFGGQLGGLLLDLVSGLMLSRDASGKIWPPNQLSAGYKVQVPNGPFASFLETVGMLMPSMAFGC